MNDMLLIRLVIDRWLVTLAGMIQARYTRPTVTAMISMSNDRNKNIIDVFLLMILHSTTLMQGCIGSYY